MDSQTDPLESLLPLSPIVFQMLLALADDEKHGYGIMKTVEQDTGGDMTISLGTLYGSIKRMMAADLIEESELRPDPDHDDERRRYYRITPLGRRALQAAAQRLARAVAVAQARYVLGDAP